MRIDRSAYVVDLSRAQEVRRENQPAQTTEGPRPAGRVLSFDRVEISPKAREMERLKADLAALPEVRLDRVALAKQNLQEGGYRVEPAVLAQKIMDAFGTR